MSSYRNHKISWGNTALTIGALVPAALIAHAEVYMSDDQAAKLIFPGVRLERREFSLNENQVSSIEKSSDESVRSKSLKGFIGPHKEVVFIDQVLGKHEFITLAVGIAADGTVKGVEILEYRETYGYQVRNEEWRKQFLGKNIQAATKVGADIKNISGATLSSVHVAGGVRRLLQTYAVLQNSL